MTQLAASIILVILVSVRTVRLSNTIPVRVLATVSVLLVVFILLSVQIITAPKGNTLRRCAHVMNLVRIRAVLIPLAENTSAAIRPIVQIVLQRNYIQN